MGRPTLCTPELSLAICERLAGGETLAEICRDEGMPGRSTVHMWLASTDKQYAAFQAAHRLARQAATYVMADEIIEISDDASNDTMLVGKEGEEREVVNSEFIQRSKLRVDTRKWLMMKFNASQFGDQIAVGGVAGSPIETKDVSRNEIARRLAFMLMGKPKSDEPAA